MVPTVDRAKATVMTKVQSTRSTRASCGDERQGRVPVQEISPEQQQPLVAVSAEALRACPTAAR